MDWGIVGAGLFIGGLVGTTGIGNASLITPALVLLGVPPIDAIPSGLVCSAAVAAAGSWQHAGLHSLRCRSFVSLAMGSVPASAVGVLLFLRLSSAVDAVPSSGMALVLMLLACVLLASLHLDGRASRFMDPPRRWHLAAVGGVVGLVAGLTSMGSGILTTAFLASTGGDQERGAVGGILFHSLLIAAGAGALHLAAGTVDLSLALPFLAGAIPGALAGSRVTIPVSAALLRTAVASVLLLMSVLIQIPARERGVENAAAVTRGVRK